MGRGHDLLPNGCGNSPPPPPLPGLPMCQTKDLLDWQSQKVSCTPLKRKPHFLGARQKCEFWWGSWPCHQSNASQKIPSTLWISITRKSRRVGAIPKPTQLGLGFRVRPLLEHAFYFGGHVFTWSNLTTLEELQSILEKKGKKEEEKKRLVFHKSTWRMVKSIIPKTLTPDSALRLRGQHVVKHHLPGVISPRCDFQAAKVQRLGLTQTREDQRGSLQKANA